MSGRAPSSLMPRLGMMQALGPCRLASRMLLPLSRPASPFHRRAAIIAGRPDAPARPEHRSRLVHCPGIDRRPALCAAGRGATARGWEEKGDLALLLAPPQRKRTQREGERHTEAAGRGPDKALGSCGLSVVSNHPAVPRQTNQNAAFGPLGLPQCIAGAWTHALEAAHGRRVAEKKRSIERGYYWPWRLAPQADRLRWTDERLAAKASYVCSSLG